MYTAQLTGIVFRGFNSTRNNTRLAPFHEQFKTFDRFDNCRRRISLWFKEQSIQVAQACTKQFEFIAAQRIRRSVQIFHLYTRIWDEVALKEFMKSWRRRLTKSTQNFLISAVGVTLYDWDREKITDQEMNRYSNEIDGIYKLRDSTVVCPNCNLRIIIDVAQPNIKYCTCHNAQCTATVNEGSGGWQPFIERKDMLIWRRQEPDFNGLYAYKVYGSFPEVSADDFLSVQIDADYRKQWDPTAKELTVIESEPQMKTSGTGCSDIVYWEMIWPRLFSNRDYVFQRRWIMSRENGVVVIVSKVTDHPKVPVKPGVHRVSSYWSTMVIKPYTKFHEPGIEFGLTYFDDPGVNIPSAVTAWVALSGLADFMTRMRQASTEYKKYKKLMQVAKSSETYVIAKQDDVSELQQQNLSGEANVQPSILEEENESFDKTIEDRNIEETSANQDNNDTPDNSTSSVSKKDQGSNYYYFSRLFA